MKISWRRHHPDTPHPQALSLSDLPAGRIGVVRGLHGGKDFCSRVAALGLSIGAPVTVLQNFGRGPLIVAVRGTRLALGRGEAQRIQIEAQ